MRWWHSHAGTRLRPGTRKLAASMLAASIVLALSVAGLSVVRPALAGTGHGAATQKTAPQMMDPRTESAWFRATHDGKKPLNARTRQASLRTAAALPRATTVGDAATWQPLGPQPLDEQDNNLSGDVTAIAVNPANSNDVWVGRRPGVSGTRPTAELTGRR